MLAAVNPCGFALLPAYLSVLVLGDDAPGPLRSVGRALWLTAWMTVGFVAVFGVFGLVVSPVAARAQQYLPWFTHRLRRRGRPGGPVACWPGRELPPPAGRTREAAGRSPAACRRWSGSACRTPRPALTCSIAAVPRDRGGPASPSGSTAEGVGLFVAYSAGMGLLVGVAAVAVALARRGLVTGLRRTGRWIPRASGLLLVVVGAYVAWYGAWELRVLGGAEADDPVIELAARVQRTLAGWVRALAP